MLKFSEKNKFDTLIFLGEHTDSVNIGDRILKQKNSPFFYVLNKGKVPKKYIFTLISENTLNNDEFPKAWKDSCKRNWRKVLVRDENN